MTPHHLSDVTRHYLPDVMSVEKFLCGNRFVGNDVRVNRKSEVNCTLCRRILLDRGLLPDEPAIADGQGERQDYDVGNLLQHAAHTEQSQAVMKLVDEWFGEFCKKNEDYQTSTGNVSENFGLMGQYMKLTDKIHKLRRPMWDAEINREAIILEKGHEPDRSLTADEFNFEGPEEILRDIVGHAFLSILLMKERGAQNATSQAD